MKEYATVDEVIEIMKKVSAEGCGDYTALCNNEYYLAKKDEVPEIDHEYKDVSIGGYYG